MGVRRKQLQKRPLLQSNEKHQEECDECTDGLKQKIKTSAKVYKRINVLEEEYRRMERADKEKSVRLIKELEDLKCAKKRSDDEVEELKVKCRDLETQEGRLRNQIRILEEGNGKKMEMDQKKKKVCVEINREEELKIEDDAEIGVVAERKCMELEVQKTVNTIILPIDVIEIDSDNEIIEIDDNSDDKIQGGDI